MSRLVVVSNRVALPGESRAGGLAVGLEAALGTRGGIWFGWSGKVVREEADSCTAGRGECVRTMDLGGATTTLTTTLAKKQLWPWLHRDGLVDSARENSEGYSG